MRKRDIVCVYKSYRFKGKDPVIEIMAELMKIRGMSLSQVAKESGVSRSCLAGWFDGDTKRPMYCTVAAVASALMYEPRWQKRLSDKPRLKLIGKAS